MYVCVYIHDYIYAYIYIHTCICHSKYEARDASGRPCPPSTSAWACRACRTAAVFYYLVLVINICHYVTSQYIK